MKRLMNLFVILVLSCSPLIISAHRLEASTAKSVEQECAFKPQMEVQDRGGDTPKSKFRKPFLIGDWLIGSLQLLLAMLTISIGVIVFSLIFGAFFGGGSIALLGLYVSLFALGSLGTAVWAIIDLVLLIGGRYGKRLKTRNESQNGVEMEDEKGRRKRGGVEVEE